MNTILNAIKCVNCQLVLKSPVILPCSHSVCRHHVDQKLCKFVRCQKCGDEHEIPPKGFPSNEALAQIVLTQIDELNFGPVHQQAERSCSNFSKILDDFKDLIKEPRGFINDEINKFKNRVQIKNEELKIKIDDETEKLMGLLDDYQKRCNNYLAQRDFQEESQAMIKLNKEFEDKLSGWKHELDRLKINEEMWEQIDLESKTESKRLGDKLRFLKTKLLLNELEKFDDRVESFEEADIKFGEDMFEDDSTIEFDSTIILPNLVDKLFELCELNKDQKWELIYRASVDGFGAQDFHARCDYVPQTLTIIKTTDGFIFGGFTRCCWNQCESSNCSKYLYNANHVRYKSDEEAFIFSLRNRENRPVKINVEKRKPNQAIYCDNKYGPSFGFSDFIISDEANSNGKSFSNLGSSYTHPDYPSSSKRAVNLLAGNKNFRVQEIEVFKMFI